MPIHSCRMLHRIAASALMLLSMTAAHADNWSFLKNGPMAKFTEADQQLMAANATATVSDSKSNAPHAWKNADSGNSGTAQVLASFDGPKSVTCKRLRIANKAGNRASKANYTVCQMGDEGWRLVSSDFAPLPKAAAKKK